MKLQVVWLVYFSISLQSVSVTEFNIFNTVAMATYGHNSNMLWTKWKSSLKQESERKKYILNYYFFIYLIKSWISSHTTDLFHQAAL